MKHGKIIWVLAIIFCTSIQSFSATRQQAYQKLQQARNLKNQAAPYYQNASRQRGYDYLYTRSADFITEATRLFRTSNRHYNSVISYCNKAIANLNRFIATHRALQNNNAQNQNNNQNNGNNNRDNNQNNANNSPARQRAKTQAMRKIRQAEALKIQAHRYYSKPNRNRGYDYLYQRGVTFLNEAKRLFKRSPRLYSSVNSYADRAIARFNRYISNARSAQRAGNNRNHRAMGNKAKAGKALQEANKKLNRAQRIVISYGRRTQLKRYFNYGKALYKQSKSYYKKRNYQMCINRAKQAIHYFNRFLKVNTGR